MSNLSDSVPFKSLTPLQQYRRRHTALKTERSTHDVAWKEISEVILPRRSRFFVSDANKGTKKETKIYNSKPTSASRTQAAGMMGSVSSPARKWMRFTTVDPELRELKAVKEWLDLCEDRVLEVLSKSNAYNALHNVYADIGGFGTAAMLVEEDEKAVIRCYVFPIGSYCLAQNAMGVVDTCFREFAMTVRQLVEMFGAENCSDTVQNAFKEGSFDAQHTVVLVLEPNQNYEEGKLGAAGMRVRTCWYEANASDTGRDAKFLREGGYVENPLMTPRWNVTGEDTWGSGPGHEALGDAKMLQLLEKRKMQAFDKIVNPPMRAPTSLIGQRSSLLPGDVTHVDGNGAGQTFAPAMEVNPAAMTEFREAIRESQFRIDDAFFASLWLTMQRIDAGKMTATEVTARQQEQMLLLGPVMERLEDELLRPLIERVFAILMRSGRLPEAPPELEGQELKVEYISIMAQAQKLLGTSNIERLMTFVGHLVAVDPSVIDKIDLDQTVDEYGDAVGVPARIIRSDDEVAKMRERRAAAQQQAQQAEQAAAAVQGAKVLSETDTGSDNALTRIMNNLSVPRAA